MTHSSPCENVQASPCPPTNSAGSMILLLATAVRSQADRRGSSDPRGIAEVEMTMYCF